MSDLKHEGKVIQSISNDWQTQARGLNSNEYEIYLSGTDKITGLWLDGNPVKTYDEWLNS
jgi:hypothetical protein